MTTPTVHHNETARRYEIDLDGAMAVLDYAMEGGRQVITHTFVPSELRGRGLAETLVRAALNDARAAGRKVLPQCSYVATFIQRHQEFQPLLA